MKIYREVLEIPASRKETHCVDITEKVQNVVDNSTFSEGLVLVHTLHTTTGLTQKAAKSAGYLVQENESMLLADFGEILEGGAEKLLRSLPQIMSGRERLLDFVPKKFLNNFLGFLINLLRPIGYWKHDDFSIRTENMHPDERKNATAHIKAAMIRESILWSFSDGKLNLGRWQSLLFWDFDSKGRSKRKIQVVVVGGGNNTPLF
jgi:thiamine phosphate synthase YjbQ (UPF0047 family)